MDTRAFRLSKAGATSSASVLSSLARSQQPSQSPPCVMGSGSSKDLHSRLLQSITEHAQDVNCLAVSEDLSVLVTGSEDCTARMWSIRPAETACLGIMKGHTKYITCITITETFVVTGSSDKTIRKWDMTTCECVYVYRGHTSRIYRLICTGEFIFSTSNDKTAKAWLLDESDLVEDSDECDKMEIAEEMCIRTFRGHTLAVYPIIYVPAADDWGKDEITINPLDVIITGSADSTAKIWSFEEGTCLRTLTGHLAGIMCMVTDASATTLYTGSADKTIRSWNIQRGECLKVMEGHSGPVICLTVFNLLLYSGSQDGTARCWVREFGNCTRVYKGAKHAIICVKLHNGILFTASVDSFVRAYDAKSGALKKLFVGHESSIQCLAIVGELMYTGGADAKLNVWAVKDVDQDIEDLTVESAADSPANGTTGLDDNIDGPEGRDDGYDQPTPATLAQQRRLHDIEQRLSSYDDVDSNSRPSP